MDVPRQTAFWRLVGLFSLVFGVVMLATLLVWQQVRQQDELIAGRQFASETDQLSTSIAQQLHNYEGVLRSAAALFAASDAVSRAEWREFTAALRLDLSNPGLQGIGYLPRVPARALAAHIAQAHAEGLPQYQVTPLATDPAHEYFPVFYLEPIDWRNLRAFGFDMGSEPARAAALKQARDEGRAVLTAPLILKQETEQGIQTGVVMVWPLYRPGNNSEDGAERVQGYVYSPLRLGDLLTGILAGQLARLQLTLTDNGAISAANSTSSSSAASNPHDSAASTAQALLFQSAAATAAPRFKSTQILKVPGREWQLQVLSTPQFEQSLPRGNAGPLLLSGTCVALLLALLVVFYARQRERLHSQQTRLTQQLQQREERFQMLIDGAPNAMLIVDAEGRIEWLNPQAEQLFGYDRASLQNQPIEVLLPERYRNQHNGWRRGFQAAPSPRQMGSGRELFARRQDGSEVPVEIGLSPVQTDDGVKTIGSIIDLSARRHAEERARMLVEAAPNAIVLVNGKGQIELVNSQTEQLFGYSRAELLGQSVEVLIPESLREKHPGLRESYHRAPSQRQMGSNRELFARHKSGFAIPVEVGLAPIVAGGQRSIQAVIIDITARKAAELKLREQAEQLALANRYKSEFLANMSHELRTPLNSIMILSEQLTRNPAGNLTSKQVAHADIIRRSGGDLLNLINDILDLSKVEAGRMTLVMEAVNIRELTVALETSFRPLAEAKNLQLRFTVADDVPPLCQTDPQRLHQILRNLLSNAIKFTDVGRIELSITRQHEDVPSRVLTPEAICIAVRDTGIGIAPGQHETIFQAFRQADGSTSRRFGGTGLGLTISRQLTELLGGVLTLESTLGVGSVFKLFLPLNAVPVANSHSTLQISGASEGAPRLLIVEDDPSFAQILVDTANHYGFTSYRTERGSEALELLERLRFDAIILDLLLPDISGWQVLREIRNRPQTRLLPVHIISCVQQPMSWDDENVCYLVKPVSHDELHKLLRQLAPSGGSELSILLVEDNAVEREHCGEVLSQFGAMVHGCATAAEALAAYTADEYRCLVIDLQLPDQSGFELLQQMAEIRPLTGVHVIINTGMDLSAQQQQWLRQFSGSVIQKGAQADQLLTQAVQPFLGAVLPAPSGEDRAALPFTARDQRVLLVDDDVRNIYAMSALLEQFQLEVEVARDGQEAISVLSRDSNFALVLMDMAMPVMDGYTATRILKRERKLHLPIVALTAHAMKGDREKCLQAGADDYLAKPVDEAGMRELLARWLSPGQEC
ncbi:response regulator [Permianibacter sp. IMCC34836]|uniref:response regulator n=1 Tax=Permianibacter fluminis TaxID=2738515 RepID=UPI00155473DA|nr:response regulator [Permianibacter fluminis]NQD36692.1 response regulator [Permianibacter fluminis]